MITGYQDFIRQWALVTPHQIALCHPSCSTVLTYAKLDERAQNLAVALARQGVNEGDRVVVLARTRVEQFEIMIACLRLGAIFTPLNWRLASTELAEIIIRCRPQMIIDDQASRSLTQSIYHHLEEHEVKLPLWIQLKESTPHTEKSPQSISGSISYQDLLNLETPSDHEIDWVSRTIDPEQIAMMLYTSGTTGYPKGVMIPHRQLFWNAVNTVYACDLNPQDKALAFLPLFHTGGLNCLATPTLYRGGTVVLMDAFDPQQALMLIEQQKITATVAVPAMYQALLEVGLEQYHLGSLKTLLCGGAPCPDTLLDAWLAHGFAFRQGFGMTEIGPNCFSLPAIRVDDKRGSIGQPVLHCRAKVVNEAGESLGIGEVGELMLGGLILSSGYFENIEATAENYQDGWLKTGDLARYDEEGYFYIAGRRKEMFISGGENVYPAEIENVLNHHPEVSEVSVIGVSDVQWGEVGLAVVVLHANAQITPDELRSWCRARLAGFKTPKHIRFCTELPRNASGKVIKAQLKEFF